MMTKYWTIVFPGEHGQHVQETWNESQILNSYFRYWTGKMIQNCPGEPLDAQRCVEDWIVIHWATQTDQWGNPIDEKPKT